MGKTRSRAITLDSSGRTKKQCEAAGEVFKKRWDSKREYSYYLSELLPQLESGEITELVDHTPKYPLTVNGVLVSRYTPDFTYRKSGELFTVDIKSPWSARQNDYIMRKKLMLALYGIVIQEVF